MNTRARRICCYLILASLEGCDQRMGNQPRLDALEASPLFVNQQSALQPPLGTLTIDALESERAAMPSVVTIPDMKRGREQYEIYCVPCHGILGEGAGPVVLHGFPAPPSFHIDRLQKAELAYYYDVISQGYGVMYSFGNRVAAEDRWRIALYIRALQQSQFTNLNQYSQFRVEVESLPSPAREAP